MDTKPGSRQPSKVVRRKINIRGSIPAGSPYQISIQSMSMAIKRPGLFMFTLLVFYKQLYILGATVIRRNRRFFRLMKAGFIDFTAGTAAASRGFSAWTSGMAQRLVKRMLAPYSRIKNYYQYQQPVIKKLRSQGKVAYSSYLGILVLVFKMLGTIVFTIFNYAAPAAALVFLLSTVNSTLQNQVGLKVTYEIDGKTVELGYVHSEKEYESATRDVLARIVTDSRFKFNTASPIFTLTEVPSSDAFLTTEELANNIIKASGRDIEPAFGLYINDVFYGAVTKSTPLLSEFDTIKARSSSGKSNEKLTFDKNIRFKEGLYPSDSVVSVDSILTRINRLETYDEVYVVQAGDSPSLVAEKLNVPLSLLQEMNPGMNERGLYVGDELYSARARPFLSVRSTFTDVYDEEYAYEVLETQNATYARGYRNVTQEGIPGVRKVTAEITTLNGIEIAREITDSKILKEPVPEKVIVGVNNPQTIISRPSTDMSPSGSGISSTGFLWPAGSGKISCYLGGYPGHTGIDIEGRAGTPIYASASGTVVIAKYNRSGYGYHIMIDHGNNFTTLYAHNSELYVSVGDVVAQGQVIAAMGRTGQATGNHVHFEVRYNGKIMNPVDYVGYG